MKLTSTRPPASRCATSKARPSHQKLRETKSSSVAEKPSISAAPRNSGTRNTRILAMLVSNNASRKPPDSQLAEIGDDAERQAAGSGAGGGQAPRHEDAGDQRDVEQQLERRRELDQRQVPPGILEHHRLMHHGEFEMRRRIVDRDARILCNGHHDQRDEREAERDAQADVRQTS